MCLDVISLEIAHPTLIQSVTGNILLELVLISRSNVTDFTETEILNLFSNLVI